jgi:putative aldouronate transport system substrate-binding protein
MKRKTFLFLMAVLLGVTAFAGGRQGSRGAAAGVPVVKYLMPGNPPKLYDDVIAAVNQKLEADQGIRVEVTYIPWDVWQQRVNLMLSTGEEFDLFHIMQDGVQMATYKAMGGLTDITSLIDQHGQNVKKVIDPASFDAMRIDGKVYGIPTLWADLSCNGIFIIRKDILDRYGLPMPKNPDELLATAKTVADRWDGSGKFYVPLDGPRAVNPVSSETWVLHRTYSSFPFNVMDNIALVRGDGSVISWIESEEFKKDVDWMRRAYQMGLINPDILTMSNDQHANQRRAGNWLFLFGTSGYFEDVKKNNNPNLKQEDFVGVKFNPEKPDIYYEAVKNLNGVSSTSKHPDAAIKFFDWLYTNQENYNLFMYGRSGVDYTLTPDGKLRDTTKDENGTVLYEQADWMLGNLAFIKPGSTVSKVQLDWLYTRNPKAKHFIGNDFFFNSTVVEAEWANVQTEIAAAIAPIYLGVLDYDTAFPAALRRLKTAGLDKVIAEYQRQMKAHLASK